MKYIIEYDRIINNSFEDTEWMSIFYNYHKEMIYEKILISYLYIRKIKIKKVILQVIIKFKFVNKNKLCLSIYSSHKTPQSLLSFFFFSSLSHVSFLSLKKPNINLDIYMYFYWRLFGEWICISLNHNGNLTQFN